MSIAILRRFLSPEQHLGSGWLAAYLECVPNGSRTKQVLAQPSSLLDCDQILKRLAHVCEVSWIAALDVQSDLGGALSGQFNAEKVLARSCQLLGTPSGLVLIIVALPEIGSSFELPGEA